MDLYFYSKKILVNMHDKNTLRIEMKIAQGRAYLVFLIFEFEKYTLTTYTTVSDEAIIIEAHNPSKLSTPQLERISLNVANDAPPERGLVIISGKISDGIPNLLKTGDNILVKKSKAPDAENALTATIKAHNVGSNLHALMAPFLIPERNTLK